MHGATRETHKKGGHDYDNNEDSSTDGDPYNRTYNPQCNSDEQQANTWTMHEIANDTVNMIIKKAEKFIAENYCEDGKTMDKKGQEILLSTPQHTTGKRNKK